jgi:photosystem II stability/assembly factor-like uncharacterized protein
MNLAGNGYNVIGEKIEPQGAATASIASAQYIQANILDHLSNCGASIYVTHACKRGTWGDYNRAWIMPNFRRTGREVGPLTLRESSDTIIGTYSVQSSNALLIEKLAVDSKATTETEIMNDVWASTFERCPSECGKRIGLGQYVVAVADASGPAATANVSLSTDYGETWTLAAVDPFAVGENIKACTLFQINNSTIRILVAKEGTGAAVQGQVAYSDDWGASWTLVSIGGAAVGHGPKMGGGLFALDMNHIWNAGEAGYIYFSNNGGLTWTVQDAGVVVINDYNQVNFVDENNGMASDSVGDVVGTHDGGDTWTLLTAPTGADVGCVSVIDNLRSWVGDGTGSLYYTEDWGTTWTYRAIPYVVDLVRDLQFINDHVGYAIIHDGVSTSTIYRTINGGYTWETLPVVISDLRALSVIDINTCITVGSNAGATLAIILKAEAI